jgi:hypothetical protein
MCRQRRASPATKNLQSCSCGWRQLRIPCPCAGRSRADIPCRIGSEQANLVGNGFTDKSDQRIAVECFNNPRNNFAFALDCTNDTDLAGTGAASATAALIPMFVAVLAADVGFVNLDNAAQSIGSMFTQARADAVAHIERGFVGTEAHVAHDLQGANSLLADQHQVNDLEPITERLVRVLEDCPYQHREPIAALLSAFGALPVKGTIGDRVNVDVTAARAMDAFRPAAGYEVDFASPLVREQGVKLLCGQLGNGFNAGDMSLPRSTQGV